MTQPSIPGTDVGRPVMSYGSDGSKWIALLVDALGRLQVDATIDNVPGDLATQTTLVATLTALQSIQNLVGALNDVGLDELRVRSSHGDKILGFESILAVRDAFTLKESSTTATSSAVPGSRAWLISALSIRNNTRALTFVWGGVLRGELEVYIFKDDAGAAQYVTVPFIVPLYLAAGDKLFFTAGGGQDNDAIYISYTGYQMNVP